MPNDTEQPTDRAGRRTLVILLVVAVIGVGLWFALERPKLAELRSDVTSRADDEQTGESGATSSTSDAQTADSGATSSTSDAQTTIAGATSTTGDAQTADSGATSSTSDAQTADSGATSTTGDAQTADSGATSSTGDAQTADSGATSSTGDAQTADSGATSSTGDAQTADSGATSSTSDAQTADSGATSSTGDAQTADSGATSSTGDAQTADSGATSSTGDAQTADSGATSSTGDAQTADSGATSSTSDAQTADSGATSSTSDAQTTDSDATPSTGDAQTADSGATSSTGDTQTTIAGATSSTGDAQTADSGATSSTSDTQTTIAGATSSTGDLQTAGAGTAASQDPARPVDPDAAGDATRIAAVEPGTAAVDEGPRVSAAPDSAVEKTPVDAPPDGKTTGEVGILAAVGDAIKRLGTAIEERLDSELEVSVTYDDSQADAPKPETTPAVRTTESDATLTPGDTQAPDSDVGDDTTVAGTPGSGGAAPSDATMAGDTTAADATVAADTTATDDTIADDATAADATVAADTTATDDTIADDATATDDTVADDATATDTTIAADTTATDDTVADDATATADAGAADTEAKKYVETLTETAPQTIPVDKADHFVTPEHVISLVPDDIIENVSVDELASDETLSPDTPITVVREVEQVEDAVAEQLIADSGGDLDKELRVQVTYDDSQEETGTGVIGEDDVRKITVREALERIRTEPDRPLPVIRTVRYFQVMTLKELLDGAVGEDAFLSVVTRPYRIESATLADLLERQQAENPDSIFYLHTVLPTDDQGIWGIVHFGIIDNFARGMAIRRGEDIETYTVRIPRHADERLPDRSSSFLGLMIDRKTKESYVYNFRDNRMGRNPDRIFPGQELVIISFQPEELMAVYRHFAAS